MKVINLISGPRNLSTALMYSFAQRKDMWVLDEPFYGHYLKNGNVEVQHPSEEEILATMETSEEKVISNINELAETTNVFVKGMAHHYVTDAPTFIFNWENIILIRHPEKSLASFSKVIENPSVEDIGIKKASEIFNYLIDQGTSPTVIDSDELLKNPKRYFQKICAHLYIPFDDAMLSWSTGGIPEDGVWAKHWYKNVHHSTGFAVQKTSSDSMPKRLQPVLEQAMPFYDILKNKILTND